MTGQQHSKLAIDSEIPVGDAPLDNLRRIFLDAQLRRELDRSIEHHIAQGEPFALALFDVDKSVVLRSVSVSLKVSVLKELVQVVRAVLPSSAFVWGHGTRDDVVAVVPLAGSGVRELAVAAGEGVRRAVAEHEFGVQVGRPCRLTVTAGVAVFPTDAGHSAALMELAEGACRKGKEAGRDRVELSHPGYDHLLRLKLAGAQFDMLVLEATAQNKTISEVVREAVELVLERHSGLERFAAGIAHLQ